MYYCFNETTIKNCTALLKVIKTCFHMLWFNCELKIENENEKQNKMPHRFTTLAEHLKTKHCVFFSQRGKRLMPLH